MNKAYISILAITLSALMACSSDNKPSAPARPVKAIQLDDPKAFEGRSFPGRAKASQEVDLSFNVSGTLSELPINVGDKVKAGDLIAKLDPVEFEAKVKSATAEAKRDEQNFLRAKELVGKGYISKSDYDILESKQSISHANLELAEKALKDSILKAPFDGQVANLTAENFQTVDKQQPIARLLNISDIEMVIQIPENAISLIPHVKNIVVQFDAFPNQNIPAEVKEISNEASPDTRTYPVTLIMQQSKEFEILPGMAGKVTGQIDEKKSQTKLTIPASALFTVGSDNNSYVWLIDLKSQKVHQQPITIGSLTPTGIAVLSGLKPGDWIVTAGIHSLKENEAVVILNQDGN